MKSYSEALAIIKSEFSKLTLRTGNYELLDSSGLILAEDVYADVDLPPFDNSAVDGYAIKYGENKQWRLVGEISAGNFSGLKIREGETVLITTGGRLPEGADTVVALEDVNLSGSTVVLNNDVSLKKGANVRTQGEDLKKSEIALHKFVKIDSKAMATLAACGKKNLVVFEPLKIGILVTGDELIPIDEVPANDKLRVTNIYSLYGAVKEAGHIPIIFGFVKDDKELIRGKIREALNSNIDILLTTGGVSVGKYDFLKTLFEEEGVESKCWRANVKPGKPIYFGTYKSETGIKMIIGLPGNPVSSLVGFRVFVKPAIDFVFNQPDEIIIEAILQNDYKKKDKKRHFARGFLYREEGKWKVKTRFSQSSGNMVEMSFSNCLIVFPEEVLNPVTGDKVECILI